MQKSAVYSWRVSPNVKAALEERARRERRSLGALLDQIAVEWLGSQHNDDTLDDPEQRRLRAKAARCFGSFASGDRNRGGRVRQHVRERLRARHDR